MYGCVCMDVYICVCIYIYVCVCLIREKTYYYFKIHTVMQRVSSWMASLGAFVAKYGECYDYIYLRNHIFVSKDFLNYIRDNGIVIIYIHILVHLNIYASTCKGTVPSPRNRVGCWRTMAVM
jgi:hypothetical protein